jgi:hypothetical protein
MALYSDLYVDQGSYFSTVITIGTLGDSDLDLTNYTGRGRIKKSYTSSTFVDFIVEIIDPIAGQIEISLESETTAAIKHGRYMFDIEIVNTMNDRVTRILEGQIEIMPGILNGNYDQTPVIP